MIVADRIAVSVGGRELLDDVTLRLEPGEIVGLVGSSGSGKTTLGRVLVGLERPSRGRLEIDGAPPPRRPNGRTAMLFQSSRRSFDPRLRLGEAVQLCARGRLSQRDRNQLCALADVLPSLLERLPGQVSDGQLQRIALARALGSRPRYLVCDEPTSALDPAAAAAIAASLRRVAEQGTGILIASHDVQLLGACSDRMLQIQDGTVRQHSTPLAP